MHAAVIPFIVITDIVVVPSDKAVTFPSLSTVATDSLVEFHVSSFDCVVLSGSIVAVSVALSPSVNDN